MLRNWLTTAIRNLLRNKTYSFLNIFGLAMGIACAGLIFLWVEDELTYNDAYTKKDRLYSVVLHQPVQNDIYTFQGNSTPKLLGPSIREKIPGVANTCRTSGETMQLFSAGDHSLYQRGMYVDTTFPAMFDIELIEGRASHALQGTHHFLISEKMATRLFRNKENALGKTILLNNQQSVTITGIFKDPPQNSTLHFDWLGTMDYFLSQNTWLSDWRNYSLDTYVELEPGTDAAMVNGQLKNFIRNITGTDAGMPELLSMNDWRLKNTYENGKQSGGRIEYVRLFSLIALVIIVIACINFMNISTARSERRAREVGVRKVMGAEKWMLMLQFMGEAMLLSFFSVIMGVVLISLAIPYFSLLVEKPMALELRHPNHLGFLVTIMLLCGVVAGSYPSVYLSSFNPVTVLKTMKINQGGAALIRKGLVITQFSVSIILIVSTILIYRQINHVKKRDLGYDKNNLLTMEVRGDVLKRYEVIKSSLLNTGVVENVALNSYNTIDFGNNTTGFTWEGKNPNQEVLISMRSVSHEFIETAGMYLIEGRNFNAEPGDDSSQVIISESLAKLMGSGPAAGKYISSPLSGVPDSTIRFEVIGVIRDYVYGNMYSGSDPVMFLKMPSEATTLYVRLKPDIPASDVLPKLETVMKLYNPAYPFTYRFVDEHFNQQFQTEMLISKLARVFAALAIVISCFGLFGLAAYTAERRTKEIGIRKVLGASTTAIATMLTREFMKLIGISCLIGFPLAWWIMNSWLNDFAYRVNISWWVFGLSATVIILVAAITVSTQSIKAALTNPVKSLRSE